MERADAVEMVEKIQKAVDERDYFRVGTYGFRHLKDMWEITSLDDEVGSSFCWGDDLVIRKAPSVENENNYYAIIEDYERTGYVAFRTVKEVE